MNKKSIKTPKASASVEGVQARPRSPRQGLLARGATPDMPNGLNADLAANADSREDGSDTQFVGAVARALSLLNAFRPSDGPLGNTELAERTGLTHPTVSRLAYTLTRCGYLNYNPRYRVYELGPSAVALGNIAMLTIDVRQIARPLMQQLAHRANFNVGLGTLDQQVMVYTDAFEGDALIGLRLFAGSRLPVLTSAMGRAYLAGLEEGHRRELLDELKTRHTGNWPEMLKSVEASLAEFQEHGFCVSVGDWHKDIHGVSSPIRTPSGGRVYAINLGGPAYLLPENILRTELGPRVRELTRRVEVHLSPQATPVPATPRRGG